MPKPTISIVLGTYNRLKFLKLTIESIRQEQKLLTAPSEIIVVDGGSTDGTIKWLTKQKDVISIIQHNRGSWKGKPIKTRSWGYFMNLGFKCAQGKYICMVSDDCLIIPKAIENGYNFFEQQLKEGKKVGALAFYWRDIPFFYNKWNNEKTYYALKVFDQMYVNHGMYLKKALEEIGYIDEETYFFYSADADLCLRLIKQGYRCIESPNSYIEHYFHASPEQKKQNSLHPDQDIFYNKWAPVFRWPQDKSYFSNNSKEFFDTDKTVNSFAAVHFTNTKFWKPIIKNACKNRVLKMKKFITRQ